MLKRLRWSKLEDVKWQKHTHNWKKNMNGKTTTQTVMIQSAPSLPVDTAPAFKMCTKRFLSRFIFTIVIVVISWSFRLTQTQLCLITSPWQIATVSQQWCRLLQALWIVCFTAFIVSSSTHLAVLSPYPTTWGMCAALTVVSEADAKNCSKNLQRRDCVFWHVPTCGGCSSNENGPITCLLGNYLSLKQRTLAP